MIKDIAKLILTTKAALDVVKEKIESKACELAMQVQSFKNKSDEKLNTSESPKCKIKEKAQEEFSQLISEIIHRAQINELGLKGFIKDKLTELTNNALLDSIELNDIRAEIAALRAEISDLKSQLQFQKR